MKDRLIAIRKQLGGHKKISQSNFAELLGTSRNAIASYELGKVIPSDTFIQLLCTKFNINETWLRTGEGDMHIKTDDSLFTAFAEKYNLSPTEQEVARYCLQLTSAQRAEILNHVLSIAEIIKPASIKQESIDQELAEYRQELEAEQRAPLVYEDSDEENGTK